jgi:hypothetical protein
MMLDEIEDKLIELGYLALDSMEIKSSIYDVCSRYIATFIINDGSYYINVIVSFNVHNLTWVCKVYVIEEENYCFELTEEPNETFELIDMKEIR